MAAHTIINDPEFCQARAKRFWESVDCSGGFDACWPWTGTRLPKSGYGSVTFLGRRTTAHRIAYELATGIPIPDHLNGLHSCDNPPCCNPRHVYPGTQQRNLAEMRAKGRAGDCRLFGEEHGRCVVSDADVAKIRRLRAETGISQPKLAKRFGIGQSQVSRILRGESRSMPTVPKKKS